MKCKHEGLVAMGMAEKPGCPDAGFRACLPLSGVVLDLAFAIKSTAPELAVYLTSLAMSLANLRCLSNLSYGRLAALHKQVFDGTKEGPQNAQYMSELTFAFLASAKSTFDLIACCISALSSRVIPDESQMTDISKFQFDVGTAACGNQWLMAFRSTRWFVELVKARNRIVHRGYLPSFEYDFHDPQIVEVTIAKRDLTWTGMVEHVPGGFVKDGRGSTRGDLPLDDIAHGYVLDLESSEKDLVNALMADGLVKEISEYEPLTFTYGGSGMFLVHRRVGGF